MMFWSDRCARPVWGSTARDRHSYVIYRAIKAAPCSWEGLIPRGSVPPAPHPYWKLGCRGG